MGFSKRDVTNVWHLIWMLLVSESVVLLAAVRDKQLPAGGSDVTAAMVLEHPKLVHVFAEPHQITVGLREQVLELRIVREFLNDD
jgi:hypothetical protein